VRLLPLLGPPRAQGIPARTRSGQKNGSSGRTPGSSADWRRVSRSSGSSNGSRRTRSQKAGDGYPGLHVAGVGRTRRSLEDSERSDQSIPMGRPGPRSLHWSQAGTAGLREYMPHNHGKARRRNRDSEGPSKRRGPARVMGSEVTRLRSDSQEQDSDWLRISGPTADPLRPGLESVARLFTYLFSCASSASRASQQLHLSSEVIAPRPSLLGFARPPALCGNGGASLTGFSRATHAWDRLSAGTPARAVTAVTTVPAP
jgi:hypothetical protein